MSQKDNLLDKDTKKKAIFGGGFAGLGAFVVFFLGYIERGDEHVLASSKSYADVKHEHAISQTLSYKQEVESELTSLRNEMRAGFNESHRHNQSVSESIRRIEDHVFEIRTNNKNHKGD